MAKILSTYLSCEFEVATFESGDAQIISHDALEDIVHNQIPMDLGVRYDFSDLLISDKHNVVRCTITDSKGRRIQAIGETVPATLETEIAQNYPVLMASQRAFDRAAIRYLGLSGKVYSNTEGVADVPPKDEAANGGTSEVNVDELQRQEAAGAQDAAAPAAETPAVETPAPSPAPAPKAEKPAPKVAQQASTPRKDTPKPAQPATPKQNAAPAQASTTDPGSVLMDIGRYRNTGKTVATVYAEDASYVRWTAESYSAKTEETRMIKKACADYVASKG